MLQHFGDLRACGAWAGQRQHRGSGAQKSGHDPLTPALLPCAAKGRGECCCLFLTRGGGGGVWDSNVGGGGGGSTPGGGGGGVDRAPWLDPSPQEKGSIGGPPKILPRLTPGPRK